MTSINLRHTLLGGAAVGLCSAIAALSFAGSAQAQSVCTNNIVPSPDTFSCNDPTPTPAQTASGTFTDGATFNIVPQGVSVSITTAPLTATMTGTINTTTAGQQAVSLSSHIGTGGLLTYTSTGTATSTGLGTVTTQLFGKSVNAVTGTNLATNNSSYGVWSRSTDGSNTITAGTTTVSGTNSTGLLVEAFDGAALVNTGVVSATNGSSVGVVSFTGLGGLSVCGSNTVNVTGNVTASGYGVIASGCGAATVIVNAGTTVSTPISGSTTIVTQAGTVATTVINGTVNAGFTSNLAVNQNGTSSLLVNNGTLFGRYDGTAGADTFVNNNSLSISGTSDFQAGADLFVNNSTMTTDGPTTFAGLESFFNNTLLTLSPDLFSLPATTGFTTGGTIVATGGLTTITSLATVANSGTLNLQDGATGDVLTITNDYAGSGLAALAIDVGSTTTDLLVIGGNASGTTSVRVNSLAPAINPTGLLVVETGTSTTGAFVLGAVTGATTPLIDYRLSQVGQDYYLVSTPSALAYQPLAIGHLASDMWYQSADVYGGYSALRRGDLRSDRTTGGGIWAQLYGSRDTYGESATVTAFGTPVTIDGRMRTERRGAQVGMDFLPIGAGFVIGATGGYQHAKANLRGYGDALDANGFNIGLYAMFGAKSGLYGGLLVKHDRDKIRLNERAFGDAGRRLRSTSNGIDAEIGYRMGLSGMNLDLNAGISHVRTKVDDFVVGPLGYDLRGAKSMRGRLGARLGLGGAWGPYIDAKLLHEFKGNSRLILSGGGTSADVTTAGRGTWGRIEVGAGANNSPGPILAGWAEFGDVKGLGARAGFRF